MSTRRDNRVAAMQFLYQWSLNSADDLGAELILFFKEMPKPRDYYGFAEELIHGAITHLDEIDTIIKSYLRNWDFDRIARIDLAILRLAIYEMLKRRDIPPVVSINEAIDLSKDYSIPDAKRFINGILDQYKLTLDRPLRSAARD
ncbi:transcription antitermination factor NusB [Puniceicoccales bacterium CK1056]|uniref:Transcription antitermination protein NusB n=1 Tax=Oceanipulchritudo coccoides TaxID=2706888 RepID=A0A6B2LY45_9BACT|nr:transcription antitermination factor NusB [Oceanipulchritudo coccoides]NDV60834.1 transcription antitermination factor NusB [Oceanipulchritudo coccoides]